MQWHADIRALGDINAPVSSPSEFRSLKQEVTRLERQLTRKDKALAGGCCPDRITSKFSSAAGGKGRLMSLQQRHDVLHQIDQAVSAGARRYVACHSPRELHA